MICCHPLRFPPHPLDQPNESGSGQVIWPPTCTRQLEPESPSIGTATCSHQLKLQSPNEFLNWSLQIYPPSWSPRVTSIGPPHIPASWSPRVPQLAPTYTSQLEPESLNWSPDICLLEGGDTWNQSHFVCGKACQTQAHAWRMHRDGRGPASPLPVHASWTLGDGVSTPLPRQSLTTMLKLAN